MLVVSAKVLNKMVICKMNVTKCRNTFSEQMINALFCPFLTLKNVATL